MIDYDELKALAEEELAYAKENDYVWYFDMLMEQSSAKDDPDAYVLEIYDEHWDKVKAAIKKDYYHILADGVVAKPVPNNMMSLRDGIEMFYGNTIQDIDILLHNKGRYDDRVSFAKDVLDIFDLQRSEGEIPYEFMNYTLAIGEALSDAGRVEESDEYYESLLAKYPGNGYMIANYVLTLKGRGEKERAKELLEKHISLDMAPIEENDMLFERAWELYREEGDLELAKKYEDLQRQISRVRFNDFDRSNIERALNLLEARGPVIRTDKKIYPNDPCPCGSGKKYKKCCGKNRR